MTVSNRMRTGVELASALAALTLLILLFVPGLDRASLARNELEIVRRLDTLARGKIPRPTRTVEWSGYLVRIEPEGTSWLAIAWPRVHGQTGIRAFSVGPGTPVRVTANEDGALDGVDAPPPTGLFGRGGEKRPWRPLPGFQNHDPPG